MDYSLAALAVLIALVIITVRSGYRAHQRSCEELDLAFPPISDEEFVKRCSAGTNPQVALRVRRIVAESLGANYDRLHPSTRFVDDLGAY